MDVGGEDKDAIDHLFEIEYETTMTNIANPDEPQEIKEEKTKKLSCHIENGKKPANTI